MKDMNALLAGFGGQGILFMGKVIAYAGLTDGKEVSWLPSYGPEMRGGTANCSVCISSDPICSPLVVTPNVFVAMNGPSYDKFIDSVVPGGIVILDSTLVEREVKRDDITVCLVPATKLAEEHGLNGADRLLQSRHHVEGNSQGRPRKKAAPRSQERRGYRAGHELQRLTSRDCRI